MNFNSSDEALLREYLLGTLEEQDCDQIEEKLLSDEEFSKLVDLIEDEIIDEYVDGSLSKRDKWAVESYFLCPPDRQRKLKFARLLRSRLQEDLPKPLPFPRPTLWVYWGASSAVAAMLLVTASLGFYVAKLRHSLEAEAARGRKAETDLAQERALSDRLAKEGKRLTLTKEAEILRNQANSGTVRSQDKYFVLILSTILTLCADDLPPFTPSPGIIGLKVKIPLVDLPSQPSQPYHGSLRDTDGKELWSQASVFPSHKQLSFTIPYNGKWSPGEYYVMLTGISNDPN